MSSISAVNSAHAANYNATQRLKSPNTSSLASGSPAAQVEISEEAQLALARSAPQEVAAIEMLKLANETARSVLQLLP